MILSICISTYNPNEEFYNKILNILQLNSNQFDIVLSDNKSTNDVIGKLKQIQDNRLKIYELDKNYGPTYNYMNVLDKANCKYAMFLTDKDFIQTEYLASALNILEKEDFNCGYFTLDYNKTETSIEKYESAKNSLKKMAYLSKHPSGYFYNNNLLKKINIIEHYSNTDLVGFFPFEFICADLATLGNCAIINAPLIKTCELKIDTDAISKTYSEKNNNLFFDPEHRLDIYLKYARHCKTLNNINYFQKIIILKTLTKNLFKKDLKNYANIVSQEKFARYYQFQRKDLTSKELKNIANSLINSIEKEDFLSVFEKNIIKFFAKKYSFFKS